MPAASPTPPIMMAQAEPAPAGDAPPAVAAPAFGEGESAGEAAEDSGGYGPFPAQKETTLQNVLRGFFGKSPLGDDLKPCDGGDGCKKDPCLRIFGWADFDYTYRSTGGGNNPIAPVMNHYGNEFLNRQNGISVSKLLDPEKLSWGFNAIFIFGSDASFLNPTKGWFQGTQFGPGGQDRYSCQFTDLNLTAHLPILTDGGVDIKAGRQTTILGPMGAIPWQRWFDSSDYAWYNMEEGRYTGVSSVWHITKRLDWYNGFELGWGTFFAQIHNDVDYITNISYWLDEKKEKTRIWTTVLTGPTSLTGGKNTTVWEGGLQHNWNKYVYQIIDTQMVWSKGPVNAVAPPGYNERAYDAYTYLGAHLNKCIDLNSRFELYYDVDGLGYAGGFGVPQNLYKEITVGIDWHPNKWMQFRPEIRWDSANADNFGQNFDKKNQISIAADLLLKF
ncbi:hypothetical protein AYO40_00125 [Planctomycetaceae bacterium SCGC AG-212-D15]|nr:hypothetical protein AYO40_00125 [Planctomycetaceae bacterium SCGC AG-212-D15]